MEVQSDRASYTTTESDVIYAEKDDHATLDDGSTILVMIALFVLCYTGIFSIVARYIMNKNKQKCQKKHDQSAKNMSGVCKVYIYI